MVSGSLISDLVQTVIMLLIMGLGFYYLRDWRERHKALIEYENSFLELHNEIISRQRQPNSEEVIPLTFQRQDIEYLVTMCERYKKSWLITRYFDKCFYGESVPDVRVHYLHFRKLRLAPTRMKIKVIRCAETYALVDAGDGHSGYFLDLDRYNSDPDHVTFNIAMKFKYNHEDSLQAAHGIQMASHREQSHQ